MKVVGKFNTLLEHFLLGRSSAYLFHIKIPGMCFYSQMSSENLPQRTCVMRCCRRCHHCCVWTALQDAK